MPRNCLSVEERFWPKVAGTENADQCWEWQGNKDRKGYGLLWMPGDKAAAAHRVSYTLNVGPIPPDYTIDHLCRNHACVNPAHLEAVTRGENVLRGEGIAAQRARQTHCKNGHRLSGDNLTIRANGTRRCKTCAADRLRAWRRRQEVA